LTRLYIGLSGISGCVVCLAFLAQEKILDADLARIVIDKS
jgi:hypothetical protein